VVRNVNRYGFGIVMLVVALLLASCQPIQPIDPAASSQLQTSAADPGNANGSSQEVPQEVRDLEGTYVGAWTLFGLDEERNVIPLASWTDTIWAENAQVDGEQAYVLTTSEMVFEGSGAPPMTFTGREGYFLMPDGSLGDYFVETFGQVSTSTQVDENVWISVTPVSADDLTSYRLPNDSSGQHVLVKVVTREEAVEIHRITRVTTVRWLDSSGQDRSSQFVSLAGFHQRQPD
jgi:hypothetical protein